MGKKATRAEANLRKTTIAEQLLQGWSRPEIIEYAGKKWGILRSQVDVYISQVNKEIKEKCQLDIKLEFNRSIMRLQRLFNKSYNAADYKTALQVQKEINELLNVKKNNVELSGSIGVGHKLLMEIIDKYNQDEWPDDEEVC